KARKGAGKDRFVVRRRGSGGRESDATIPISTASCMKNPGHKIPLEWSPEAEEVLSQVWKSSNRLGSDKSPFMPKIALQAYLVGVGAPPQTREDAVNRIFHT